MLTTGSVASSFKEMRQRKNDPGRERFLKMSVKILHGDITTIESDVIVNAANSSLLGGGGVDGAIHKAAGAGLLFECMRLGGCKVGQAKMTKGYRMPCKYIIHTVGPKWKGGHSGEEELLRSCYRESIRLAIRYECKRITFPLISSGIYGYPKTEAIQVALETMEQEIQGTDIEAVLVLFDRETKELADSLRF